ncbi:GntR family transcriptional regulator [Treponema primitia]|uniref:GntR family transcriptional regulator n=1 Tax=Treponema primitia TaxID=88058 RepID=UPI003980DCAA
MKSINLMPMRVRVASELRKAILAGEFKEGQSLSLTELSKQLGISRTPIREAFQTLAEEGFIELRMNKHALVLGIDLKFIQDHYRMRILLEGEAAFCAANNNMDTGEIAEITRNIKNKLPGVAPEEFADYNQRFHTIIWESADNQRLYSFLMSLWNGASKGKAVSNMDHFNRSIYEHEQIISAIAGHQAEQSQQFMHKHVSRGLENMLRSYQLPRNP